MIPVYYGNPHSPALGYVTPERAKELVSKGAAVPAKKGKWLRLFSRVPPPLIDLKGEARRIATIAAEDGAKCQAGLMNPR